MMPYPLFVVAGIALGASAFADAAPVVGSTDAPTPVPRTAWVADAVRQDTVVEVRRGDRLVLENFSGTVFVGTWDRDLLEVRGEPGDRAEVSVVRSGSRIALRPSTRRGRDREVDAVLRVPAWMDVEIGGRELDVSVRGLAGSLAVRNIEGDIDVEDTRGTLRLHTVDGEIRVRNARGSVEARSRGDDVSLFDVVGDVDVESGSGDLLLDGVDGASVRAETLDGDVTFRGPIRRGGRYAFSVHDGDAVLAFPPGSAFDARVATFDGDFQSEFPVTLQNYRGGRAFEFTLGGGGAMVEIEVFDGEIRLLQRR